MASHLKRQFEIAAWEETLNMNNIPMKTLIVAKAPTKDVQASSVKGSMFNSAAKTNSSPAPQTQKENILGVTPSRSFRSRS